METFTESKDPSVVTDAAGRESRSMEPYSIVFYWIGWIAVAYLVIYVLAVFVGPAIFGTRGDYPFYYGRSLRARRHLEESNLRLVAKVIPALEKQH